MGCKVLRLFDRAYRARGSAGTALDTDRLVDLEMLLALGDRLNRAPRCACAAA